MAATTKSWVLVGLVLAGLAGWETYATAGEGANEGQDPFAAGGDDPFSGGADPFAGAADDPFAAPAPKPKPESKPQPDHAAEHHGGGRKVHEAPAEERPGEEQPVDPLLQPVFWANGDREVVSRIYQILGQRLHSTGLEFHDAPLEEVVDFLRREYRLEIQLDETALDDLGIGTDEPVTCRIHNVSLMSGLRLMLKQLELTYVITDETLLVTTEEEAETRLTIGIYPTRGVAKDKRELIELVDVVIATVASETWADSGGGEAKLRPLEAGFLVVSQTQAVHEELIEFLSALRRAKAASED